MPPRYGKSTIVKYFIAWSIIRNPASQFLYTSYSDRLVSGFSDEIKNIIKGKFINKLFALNITKNKDSKQLWGIESFGGQVYATPIGGQITGFGAGMFKATDFAGGLIIDDPMKVDDARSPVARQHAIEYFVGTLLSRLNAPSCTPIILIMQRLHTEDICGYIQHNPTLLAKFKILKYQAFDEDNNLALWEEKNNITSLLEYKQISPAYYYSQLQQEPVQIGGGVIKVSFFKTYKQNELYAINSTKCFFTADTAYKAGQHNDYSVFCCWLTDGNNLYLLDMIRGKWEDTELREKTKSFYEKWREGFNYNLANPRLYIEDKASGISLIQHLRQQTSIPVMSLSRNKDKYGRWLEVEAFVSSQKVFLPENNQQILHEFLSECEGFTDNNAHAHDDIVDNLIDAVYLTFVKRNYSLHELYGKK